MKFKYAVYQNQPPVERKSGRGRRVDPNSWICGPDPQVRDKYYSYLKHRSQAHYRGEEHTLTWECWQELFTDAVWEKRGRRVDDLCLGRLDWTRGWHDDNVKIMTRREHFELKKQINKDVA